MPQRLRSHTYYCHVIFSALIVAAVASSSSTLVHVGDSVALRAKLGSVAEGIARCRFISKCELLSSNNSTSTFRKTPQVTEKGTKNRRQSLSCICIQHEEPFGEGKNSKTSVTPSIPIVVDHWTFGLGTSQLVELSCHDAVNAIWEPAGEPEIPVIKILKSEKGPFVVPDPDLPNGFIVYLNSESLDTRQIIYSMGHEFGHILCGLRDLKHEHKWFEEALCECSALYALRSVARMSRETGGASDIKYGRSLMRYADLIMNASRPVESLSNWYSKHKQYLARTSTDYTFNLPASLALLKYFEENPEAWACVRYLNSGPPGESLEDHLDAWKVRVPEKFQQHVDTISAMFIGDK